MPDRSEWAAPPLDQARVTSLKGRSVLVQRPPVTRAIAGYVLVASRRSKADPANAPLDRLTEEQGRAEVVGRDAI